MAKKKSAKSSQGVKENKPGWRLAMKAATLPKNDLLIALEKLEKSAEYTSWRKSEPDSYLAHFFYLDDPENRESVQIGYYNEKKQRMTTFVVGPAGIEVQPDLEVLKREETPLLALDRGIVGFDSKTILAKADIEQADKYPRQPVFRKFFILQKLDIGQVYNVTLFTQTFKTINFKFDARSGELLKHNMGSLIQMDKGAGGL